MKLDHPLAMVIKGNNNSSFRKGLGDIKKLSYNLLVLKLLNIKAGRRKHQKHPHSRLSPPPTQSAHATVCEDIQCSLWARSLLGRNGFHRHHSTKGNVKLFAPRVTHKNPYVQVLSKITIYLFFLARLCLIQSLQMQYMSHHIYQCKNGNTANSFIHSLIFIELFLVPGPVLDLGIKR